jgi:antitoxin component YwqK of YwqJK toxin-antitoxin module
MKKSVLLFVFFSCIHFCFGQKVEYKKFFHSNGKVSSEGYWINERPTGYWRTYSEQGILVSEGNRKQGELDSTWKFYDSKGRLERKVSFLHDKRNGLEVEFDSLGIKVLETNYELGVRQGKQIEYYSNGSVHWQRNYDQNNLEGKAREYNEIGILITVIKYSKGFIQGAERFNRVNGRGEKEGPWKEFFPGTELVFSEGNFSSGKKNGLFQYFDKKGIVIRTETYENDVLVTDNGQAGNLVVKEEKRDSITIIKGGYLPNGKKQGVFYVEQRGEEEKNEIYQEDIKIAEGKLDSGGIKQGQWIEYYLDGSKKGEGIYKDGQKEGKWTYYTLKGTIEQTGTFKKGIPEGEWLWYYTNGFLRRREEFSRGNLNGEYIEKDSSGNEIIKGNYSEGVLEGNWRYELNDHIEEGSYVGGEKNGIWRWFYFQDELAFEGEFNMGVPVGRHKLWYQNGQLKERGLYESGVKEGDWQYYDEIGTLKMTINFKSGEMYKVDGVRVLPKE